MRTMTRAGVVAGILAGLVAGCGPDQSDSFATQEGEGRYTVDTKGGETRLEVDTAEGTATVRSGANVPVDLPAGFSVYPGATIVNSSMAAQGEGRVASIMMQTGNSMDEVIAFYREQAERNGVSVENETSSPRLRAFAGRSDAVEQMAVVATRSDNGTVIQLTVAQGLE